MRSFTFFSLTSVKPSQPMLTLAEGFWGTYFQNVSFVQRTGDRGAGVTGTLQQLLGLLKKYRVNKRE